MAIMIPFVDSKGDQMGFVHWCPGCQGHHQIYCFETSLHQGPVWQWDGNLESPTFSPSFLTRYYTGKEVSVVCHTFIRNGKIEFLGDSTHSLAGQTVDMPELPE